jgi:hypothetical protein
VHDDVRAALQRFHRVRGREGVVHHQLGARFVREIRQSVQVRDLELRIGHRLGVDDRGRRRGDLRGPGVQVRRVDHDDVETQRGQITQQQVTRVAVDLARGHDPASALQQRDQGGRDRGHPGGGHQRGFGALEFRDLGSSRVDGRVGEPAVPMFGQAAVALDVLVRDVVEIERGRLVDRRYHRPGAGHIAC